MKRFLIYTDSRPNPLLDGMHMAVNKCLYSVVYSLFTSWYGFLDGQTLMTLQKPKKFNIINCT